MNENEGCKKIDEMNKNEMKIFIKKLLYRIKDL